MTAPSYPTFNRRGFRMYQGQDGLADVPGVTSVLKNIDKSGLGFARARSAAQCAWNDVDKLVGWVRDGNEKAAIDHIRNAASREWGAAADLGTEVHELSEQRFKFEDLGHIQKKHQGFMEQLDKFINDFDVEPLEIEATCWNSTVGYAGTADLIARIGGEIVLLDLKTGKSGIYPDVALQLAAYGHAEFIISPDGSRRELPELGGAAALSLRPDHYSLVPVRIDDDVFDLFKHLVAVAEWQREISRTVLGNPVEAQNAGGES